MKTLRFLLLAGTLLCPVARVAAQVEDLPHVRPDGRRLVFAWHGGSPHKLDVANLIRSVGITSATVLTARREGEIDYFVVDVRGPSHAVTAGESNVAGTEGGLLWLKLRSWKMVDSQLMPYRSSRDWLDPIGEPRFTKLGVLTVRYANRRESTEYLLRYDMNRPEEKIVSVRASDVE